MQWRLLTWDPDHTKKRHGGVDCPGHVTAVAVENDEKDQRLHSKKTHCYYSWEVAVAGCCLMAAIENLYSAAAGCSDLTLPAEKLTDNQVSRRSNSLTYPQPLKARSTSASKKHILTS